MKYMQSFCLFFLLAILLSAEQETMVFTSEYIPYPDTVLITLPDLTKGTNPIPLVFLLHGWSGDYKQWSKICDLQKLADTYKCIVISPSGFYDSWYINSPVKQNLQYETYFITLLLPSITQKYNGDSGNIFVTGLSMGGFGALSLLLHHPDKIKSAGSTSGVLDLTHFPGKWGLEKILGPFASEQIRYKNVSPFFLLDNAAEMKNKIIIDCGTDDFAYQANVNFYNKAVKAGRNIHFISRPGAHTSQYWQESLAYHFLFFNQQYSK